MLMHGGRLWVFTSTFDPAKGTLVDVFDLDGRYLDHFYLRAADGDAVLNLHSVLKASNGTQLAAIRRQGLGRTILVFTLPNPDEPAVKTRS